MSTINVTDIERSPADFVRRIERDETLLVVREQQPLAEVKPIVSRTSTSRPFGLCAGEFVAPEDFDASLPESTLREF